MAPACHTGDQSSTRSILSLRPERCSGRNDVADCGSSRLGVIIATYRARAKPQGRMTKTGKALTPQAA